MDAEQASLISATHLPHKSITGWTVWTDYPSASDWFYWKHYRIKMVARDGVEPPMPAFSVRSTGLTTFSINNLTRQSGQFIVIIL